MQQVLLLNASFEPLHVCTWRRAVVLLIKGKAVAVEQLELLSTGGVPAAATTEGFLSPQMLQQLRVAKQRPLVIRLLHYVKIPHKEIPLTRRNVMHRDQYTCQYCGRKADLTIDHIIPRSRGGKDCWENVVIACLRCNVTKGCRTPKEAGMTLKSVPCRPVNFIQFELSKQHRSSMREFQHWKKYLFYDDALG